MCANNWTNRMIEGSLPSKQADVRFVSDSSQRRKHQCNNVTQSKRDNTVQSNRMES